MRLSSRSVILLAAAMVACNPMTRSPDAGDNGAPDTTNQVAKRKLISADSLAVSPHLSGQVVLAHGRCGSPTGEDGPPPVSRSDWLLVGNHRSVYVVGDLPSECHAGNNASSITIVAQVSVDSIATVSGVRPRVFLLRSR